MREERTAKIIGGGFSPLETEKYLSGGRDFIDEDFIQAALLASKSPSRERVMDIIAKSLSVETLTLEETACLLNVSDRDLLDKMEEAALQIKKKVYDNRIVTFAPLYLANRCVNDCLYCGFRASNKGASRKVLTDDEIACEVKVLAGEIGHKRLIAVYGEHPDTGVDYIVNSLKTIYSVKEKARIGYGQIRRVNVNAAPLSVDDLRQLKDAGIGTYQVFQETYHHQTYARMHPAGTIKSDYRRRLYCMHRALEAGVDDVGLGVLFGLYDWKFEVMGLVAHTRELENRYGIGAHTISFPRLEPAQNSEVTRNSPYKVSDKDFLKIMNVIRLAVPHTGMIITARENAAIRRASLKLGITQTDASTRIGVGAYSNGYDGQREAEQQFLLGDTRSLDELIREFSELGLITSFCTAGYRCGRTGECIMELLKTGQEGKFCKLNAVLTFREWVDDFATSGTKAAAEKVLSAEIDEVKARMPQIYGQFMEHYSRIKNGERDLYF